MSQKCGATRTAKPPNCAKHRLGLWGVLNWMIPVGPSYPGYSVIHVKTACCRCMGISASENWVSQISQKPHSNPCLDPKGLKKSPPQQCWGHMGLGVHLSNWCLKHWPGHYIKTLDYWLGTGREEREFCSSVSLKQSYIGWTLGNRWIKMEKASLQKIPD